MWGKRWKLTSFKPLLIHGPLNDLLAFSTKNLDLIFVRNCTDTLRYVPYIR
jgi:hypothetical protein